MTRSSRGEGGKTRRAKPSKKDEAAIDVGIVLPSFFRWCGSCDAGVVCLWFFLYKAFLSSRLGWGWVGG